MGRSSGSCLVFRSGATPKRCSGRSMHMLAAARHFERVHPYEISARIPAFVADPRQRPLPEVANVIAVASGKGGVGKSTVAANLALALAAQGARTGLLDADIYGPSMPRMMGLSGQRPTTTDGKTLDPPRGHGLPVMSIGFLVDSDQPMAWRGPMVTQALTQMLADTRWGTLDYLVVDMPPGTGDIQLTLTQRVPVSGAVIVTTPQEIALLDARKGLQMFRKVGVPVLGIVENMGLHRCPACGHESHIFDSGGGKRARRALPDDCCSASCRSTARSASRRIRGGRPSSRSRIRRSPRRFTRLRAAPPARSPPARSRARSSCRKSGSRASDDDQVGQVDPPHGGAGNDRAIRDGPGAHRPTAAEDRLLRDVELRLRRALRAANSRSSRTSTRRSSIPSTSTRRTSSTSRARSASSRRTRSRSRARSSTSASRATYYCSASARARTRAADSS